MVQVEIYANASAAVSGVPVLLCLAGRVASGTSWLYLVAFEGECISNTCAEVVGDEGER